MEKASRRYEVAGRGFSQFLVGWWIITKQPGGP